MTFIIELFYLIITEVPIDISEHFSNSIKVVMVKLTLGSSRIFASLLTFGKSFAVSLF